SIFYANATGSQPVAATRSLPAAFLGEVQVTFDSSHATIKGIDAHAEASNILVQASDQHLQATYAIGE
ncbi:MAG: hypothetical protein KIS79_06015, partial [Burkholderiales bacterium]|nr:hypothetical protein [Burkholderiales bacterium]